MPKPKSHLNQRPHLSASIKWIGDGTLYLLLNTGQLRVEDSDGMNMLLHFLFFLPKLTVEVSSFFTQSRFLLFQFGNLLASAFCFFFSILQLLKRVQISRQYHRFSLELKFTLIGINILHIQIFKHSNKCRSLI